MIVCAPQKTSPLPKYETDAAELDRIRCCLSWLAKGCDEFAKRCLTRLVLLNERLQFLCKRHRRKHHSQIDDL